MSSTPILRLLRVGPRPTIAVWLAGTLLFGALGCKKEPTEANAAPARSKGARGGAGVAFAVDVMPVMLKTVDYLVEAPGTLDAFEHIQVTARVAGVVDKVNFQEGQAVKKGNVLAVID